MLRHCRNNFLTQVADANALLQAFKKHSAIHTEALANPASLERDDSSESLYKMSVAIMYRHAWTVLYKQESHSKESPHLGRNHVGDSKTTDNGCDFKTGL